MLFQRVNLLREILPSSKWDGRHGEIGKVEKGEEMEEFLKMRCEMLIS